MVPLSAMAAAALKPAAMHCNRCAQSLNLRTLWHSQLSSQNKHEGTRSQELYKLSLCSAQKPQICHSAGTCFLTVALTLQPNELCLLQHTPVMQLLLLQLALLVKGLLSCQRLVLQAACAQPGMLVPAIHNAHLLCSCCCGGCPCWWKDLLSSQHTGESFQ